MKPTKHMRHAMTLVLAMALFGASEPGQTESGPANTYVGSAACENCHESEYERFTKYAKKHHSFENISKLKDGLTESEFAQCLECHTTGYGRPGGFVSIEATPHLRNPGCEVCHGAGGLHVASQDPSHIRGAPTLEQCSPCHNQERVDAFNFKPLIHGGAH